MAAGVRGRGLELGRADVVYAQLIATAQGVGLGGRGGGVVMQGLVHGVSHVEGVGRDQASPGQAVPVGDGAVVLLYVVLSSVLELDAGVAAKGHQVGEEKAVGRLDLVL